MRKTLLALAIAITIPAFAPAYAYQNAGEGIIVRQKSVPIDQVLGGKYKPTAEERNSAKEAKRHNKALEKELRKFRKDSVFTLGTKKQKQPKRVKSISANSNEY